MRRRAVAPLARGTPCDFAIERDPRRSRDEACRRASGSGVLRFVASPSRAWYSRIPSRLSTMRRRSSSSAFLFRTRAMTSESLTRGFWRTKRRISLFASRMRIVRASRFPRSASLIFSDMSMIAMRAWRLAGGGAVAVFSGSSTSSWGSSMPSSPASMARRTAATFGSVSGASGMPLGLGRLRLLDHLFRDVRWRLLVVGELQLEVAAPARHRAEIGRVAEHLRHRHGGLDDLLAAALRLGALDLAAPAVQVADDVAHVLVGNRHADGHDRLEEDGTALLERGLEREPPGDLERHLGRVDVVVRAEVELRLHVDDRIAGEDAL